MSKIRKAAIDHLRSTDIEQVKKGIAILEEQGRPEQIQEILEIYLQNNPGETKKLLYELLSSISLKTAVPAWIETLRLKEFILFRADIINILWNTRLDFTPHLEFFVKLACDLDYHGTLECLTLIEQMEGPFQEHQLLESELLLKEHVKKNKDEGDAKKHLITMLATYINQLTEDE